MSKWMIVFTLIFTASISRAQQQPPVVYASAAAHQGAVDFVELTGMRQNILAHKADMVQAGKDQILKSSPNVDPAFVEEWGKRMLSQFNVDAYVAVAVRVYETHFTSADLQELIQAQRDAQQSKQPNLSAALRQKLTTDMTAIQSEIIGGCSQVGAKVGGEIGQELQKEHPEWFKQQPTPPFPSSTPPSA